MSCIKSRIPVAKLIWLRLRAVASGMSLLNEDEVLEEVRRRRAGTEKDGARAAQPPPSTAQPSTSN